MHKHLVGTLAVAAVALAASAVPAFSADSGTLTVSITAQAPAAPCLTVTPGSVNFGTLPFSTNAGAGRSSGKANITANNCGTAGQNLLGSTTDATGPGGSWTPLPEGTSINPCMQFDRFYLSIFGFTTPILFMTGTAAPVLASIGGPPAVFPAGGAKVFELELVMPCQGSNGPGATKTLSATFTATVA